MKLKEKENLIQGIGMKFDEAVELFSDETLQSMAMVNIVGGANKYCEGAQCTEGCQNECGKGCQNSGCGSKFMTIVKDVGTVAGVLVTIATLAKTILK